MCSGICAPLSACVLLLLMTLALLATVPSPAHSQTITVTADNADFVVGASAGDDFPTLQDALSDPQVQDGHTLFLRDGVYSTVDLDLNKGVTIVGESLQGTILREGSAGALATSMVGVRITVDGVHLSRVRIEHLSSQADAAAVDVRGGGYPNSVVQDTRLQHCHIVHSGFAVVMRGRDWSVMDTVLEFAGHNTGNQRCFLLHAVQGEAFIRKVHVVAPEVGSYTFRHFIYMSGSGSNTLDAAYQGTLVVEGVTHEGKEVVQFLNQDVFPPNTPAEAFSLVVRDCVTTENNAFIVLVPFAANDLDMYAKIVLVGNTLTNQHHASGGKGILGVDAAYMPAESVPRTGNAPLPVFASGNTLGQSTIRTSWQAATGASGAVVAYSPPTSGDLLQVTQSATIPFIPTAPGVPVTWFLHPAGSNSNDGRTPDTPKLTLANALSSAAAGDTIVFAAGSYPSETVTIPADKSGISILGPNAEISAKLGPDAGRASEAELTTFRFTVNTDDVVIAGLKIVSAVGDTLRATGGTGRSGIVFRNNYVQTSSSAFSGHILNLVGSSSSWHQLVEIEGCRFEHFSTSKWTLWGSFIDGLIIRGNWVSGPTLFYWTRGFNILETRNVVFEGNYISIGTTSLQIGDSTGTTSVENIMINNNVWNMTRFTPVRFWNSNVDAAATPGAVVSNVVFQNNLINFWTHWSAVEVRNLAQGGRYENLIFRNNEYRGDVSFFWPEQAYTKYGGCLLFRLRSEHSAANTAGASSITIDGDKCSLSGGAISPLLPESAPAHGFRPSTFSVAGVAGFGNINTLNITNFELEDTTTSARDVPIHGVVWGDTFRLQNFEVEQAYVTRSRAKIWVTRSHFKRGDSAVTLKDDIENGTGISIENSLFEGIPANVVTSNVAAVSASRNYWGHPRGPRDR